MARILVAEDEASVLGLILRALAEDGHQALGCPDGAAALDLLTREEGRFDLILTDIMMPLMDGIALALAAARDHPALPVLLMTGYADQRERATGLEAIVCGILAKPFTLAELRFAVSAALAAGQSR